MIFCNFKLSTVIQKAKTKIFDQYFENIHNKIQKQGSRQCFQYSISFVRKRRKYWGMSRLLGRKNWGGKGNHWLKWVINNRNIRIRRLVKIRGKENFKMIKILKRTQCYRYLRKREKTWIWLLNRSFEIFSRHSSY